MRAHLECFSTCSDRLLSFSSLPVRPAGPGQRAVYVCVAVVQGVFVFTVYTPKSMLVIVGMCLPLVSCV